MGNEVKRSIYQGDNYDLVYSLDNYIIKERKQNQYKSCVIYCSSSGLYYPNTEEEFVKAFIEQNDKYEWKTNRISYSDKSIWIRDITKEFYIKGINNEICTIDKLVDFLRKETSEYDAIITVGSSGGGYIATLIGCLLNAKRVFAFSAFFDLTIIDKAVWPLVAEYAQLQEYKKWYQIYDTIRNSKTLVFYFYPGHLSEDCIQAKVVKDLPNVKEFCFNSYIHGIPFTNRTHLSVLNKLLNLPEDKLLKLYSYFNNKLINNTEWLFRVILS